MLRTLLLLCSLLIVSSLLFAQTDAVKAPASGTSKSKNPIALSALNRLSSATGWTSSLRPLSIKATGKISRVNPETGESANTDIVFKVQGPDRYRIENHGAVDAVTIVNSNGAYSIANGKEKYLPLHAAASIKPVFLPFLLDSFDANSSEVEVEDSGTEKLNSESTHKVSMKTVREGDDHATRAQRRASPITFWISESTSLPLQMEHVKVTLNNENALLHVIRKLSDYRRVNGILIPFHQEEWIGGELSYTLELTEVNFNPQLEPSDFEVPRKSKGGR